MRWERTCKFEQMSACYLLAHEITTVLTTQRHISKLTATKTRRNYELAFAQHNPCSVRPDLVMLSVMIHTRQLH